VKAPALTEEIRYDMSQFYSLKSVLEKLMGHSVYMRLKETATLSDWQEEVQKLLLSIKMAIKSTVEIADNEWFDEIDVILESGEKDIVSSKTVTELFARFSATLTQVVFLQIGFLPLGRQGQKTIPLKKEYWTLNKVRTVQYIQSNIQSHEAQKLRDKRKGGAPVPTLE
jgi:hypothetical protein